MDGPSNDGVHRVIGSDGKVIEARVPRFLKQEPWYSTRQRAAEAAEAAEGASGALESEPDCVPTKRQRTQSTPKWEAKRDRYRCYNAEEYAQVVSSFKPKQPKQPDQADKVIIDQYSRVVAAPSTRDLKDTAFYLRDLGEYDLDFEETAVTQPAVTTMASEKVSGTGAGAAAKDSGLGHSSVFGSWWENGQWGYKCCKQTHRDGLCSGIQ